MYDLMLYSLKTAACLAVFYLFFKLLLSRETFHRLNRILLLGAILLSFLLPLCVITVEREMAETPQLPVLTLTEMPVSASPVIVEAPAPFPWETVAGVLFLLGAAVTLAGVAWSLAGVLRLIRRGRRERLADGSVLVLLSQPVTPFSWGRYVVLSEADYAENGAAIVTHEQAHLHLRHSLDLLLTDLAGCLQWFNPAMWLLRRELRAIHEYEADEAVLRSGVDARQYQLLLIKKAVGGRWYSVANSFNHSKLKNRITMMLREKSSRWAGAKSLLVLPLAGLALGAFAETAYVYPKDKGNKQNVTIAISGSDISSPELSGTAVSVVDLRAGVQSESSTTVTVQTPPKDLQAAAAEQGLQVTIHGTDTNADGSVQKDSVFIIRGTGSPSKTQPIYLVDGVEVSGINDIKPEDVISLSVTKDSTALSQYGGRAKDGVVTVTTKKIYTSTPEILRTAIAEERNSRQMYASLLTPEGEQKRGEISKAQIKQVMALIDKKVAEMEAALTKMTGEKAPKFAAVTTTTTATTVKYGKGDSGAKVVTTTTSTFDPASFPGNMLILVNGQKITKADFDKIPKEKLKEISIITMKGIEKYVKKYGEEARNGVVIIKTKK